jgi:hypothetical protein
MRAGAKLVSLALIALAGCHSSIETTPGTGGGAACASACEATIEGWTKAASLLTARRDHATFIVETPAGTFLYVAGGASTGAWTSSLSDVERGEIHEDGSVGPFTVVATLPKGVDELSVAQLGRAVILVGGRDTYSSADTYVGLVADDGSITFEPGSPLGVARHGLTAVAHGGFVYAIGGVSYADGGPMMNTIVTYSDAVERAPFDGKKLGAFELLAPLPQPLFDHGSVVVDDGVYLLGGRTSSAQTSTSADVVRAPFAGDAIGPFSWAGAFVSGRARLAALARYGSMFTVGDDHVSRAPLHADGTTGAFADLEALPEPRKVRQAPEHGGRVYVAGGASGENGDDTHADVFVGKLVVTGD